MTQQPEHVEDPWAADLAAEEGFPVAAQAPQRRNGSGNGRGNGYGNGSRSGPGPGGDRSAPALPEQHERGPEGPAGGFERVPPQDLEAEKSVLGGMLLSKDAIADVVEVLKGNDFYRPAHETVYQAILDLYAKGEPADPITVTAELTRRGEIARVGGPGYVQSLVQAVPTAANAEYYAEIVHERAILRRLVEAGTRITQMGYAADGDVDDIVNGAQAEIYAVTEQRTSEDYLPLGDIMEGALDEIEAIGSRSGQMTGVPTGFTDLDSLTNGLHPGQMIVIAARPAMGKSTLALDFARACSIKHAMPSVIFSLEMGRNEIAMRLLSAEARVALHHMRSGSMTDEDWTRLARQMPQVTDAPLYIDDSPNLSMMEIRAKCRRLKQRNDLQLIVIDYLQLMQTGGSRRPESRQQEVSEMSRNLKLLAKELEVPVIALSQLNRGPEQRTDKKPMVSDLRESGCLTASTRVLRADTGAEVTMGELLESGERNIPVWSVDEQLLLVPRTMTHVFPSGVKEVFRLKLASGREIEATANHPFLTYDGWKPLGELPVGARLAVPRRLEAPQRTAPWPEAEIVMLAHLLGDGCVAPRQPVHYTSNDEANLSAVEDAAAHFGITPRRVSQESWWHVYLPSPHHLTHGRRNPVAAWLDGMGLYGKRAHEKFVPAEVFGLPDAQVRLFLRHLWATDGSVTVSAASGAVRIYYATTSERLARDLQHLLLRTDIRARVRAVGNDRGHPQWTVDVSGVEDQKRFLEEIGVHGARAKHVVAAEERLREVKANTNLDTVPRDIGDTVRTVLREQSVTTRAFQAALGTKYCGSALYESAPSRARLSRVADVLSDAGLEMLATSDVFWDEVVSIESVGEQEVYDATVLGTHNFVANGIHVHNSIEQDADMVILLHREDAYEKESPRAGEADLIVAKHRNGPTATITVAFQGHYSRFVDMAQT
ncbi:replicative DNA helicase [Streptomyces sp. RK75]|uniref:replicative DNA helicase n=1 Tax=Streptomyces sp. RK75 TaxID=2824895 RepID=UPI001B36A0D1|nr:replicative DNA helicase [Streptomyces sp. RK75]MBQ0864385.1 replicative DNA helicase [Streptomyces sp. RK75]